ncbi:MAG: hypothetical protein IT174_13725 [Acidobacteria bacterium]|nr:hypothetical protein [Acidobacteriota bacterium]
MKLISSGPFRGLIAILVCVVCSVSISAQRRDYLTDEEIEVVRDAQDIDARVGVLIKMIDRRFAVLGINVNGWKDGEKTSSTWGEPPKGARSELLNDIKKILQKAVDDIDNLAANPNSAPIRDKDDKRAKKDPERFPKAVRALAAASKRYLDPLKMELDRSTRDEEKGSIIDSIDLCNQIIDAVGRLP